MAQNFVCETCGVELEKHAGQGHRPIMSIEVPSDPSRYCVKPQGHDGECQAFLLCGKPVSEAERDAPMRVPGEDAWVEELFTSGGHKDKLRTVLRAYRANLLTNGFLHKACRKAEAALLDRINTTQLEEAKDWLIILEAVCNPRQNKVARNRCLKEARQRVEDLAAAINRISGQPMSNLRGGGSR